MTRLVAIVKRTAVDIWEGFVFAVTHPMQTLRTARDVLLDE